MCWYSLLKIGLLACVYWKVENLLKFTLNFLFTFDFTKPLPKYLNTHTHTHAHAHALLSLHTYIHTHATQYTSTSTVHILGQISVTLYFHFSDKYIRCYIHTYTNTKNFISNPFCLFCCFGTFSLPFLLLIHLLHTYLLLFHI